MRPSFRAVAALTVALAAVAPARAVDGAPPADGLLRATVTHVVDGDTVDVTLRGRRERVRLIGVDAPELHDVPKLHRDAARTRRSATAIQALGRDAARFTTAGLLGKTVGLELDVERRDRYGRLLAYVWLPDGTLFNAELLRTGHAQLMTIPPNVRYVDVFRRLQREARAHRRGLWATAPPHRPAWRRAPRPWRPALAG